MKRLLSILFLNLFLFNLVGYYGVYLGLRTSAKLEMKARLDSNSYNESDAVTVKLPFSLPYQSDWDSYRRIDGGFEKDGIFYSLVKHKVERDTLVVVYIKDHKETSLFESLTRFVEATTDTPLSKKAGKIIEHFTKDFLATFSSLEQASTGWLLESLFMEGVYRIGSSGITPQSPPPWLV